MDRKADRGQQRTLVAFAHYLKTHGTPRTSPIWSSTVELSIQSRRIDWRFGVGPLVGSAARRGHRSTTESSCATRH